MSATTIPTDTVSDMVLNISSQNCEELEFLPRATVLIGGWHEKRGTGGCLEALFTFWRKCELTTRQPLAATVTRNIETNPLPSPQQFRVREAA